MKLIVCMICSIWISFSSFAQTTNRYSLAVTTGKTTSLIFPFAIKHVDRGTKDILVQQVKEAENLLLVKAAASDIKETNLSVVTADGEVYSFDIVYSSNPTSTMYRLQPLIAGAGSAVTFTGESMNEKDMEGYARGILDNPKFIHGIKDNSWDVHSKINGIYLKDNVIFYQLIIDNLSPISYDIDFIRFYIIDKRKGKRTASQELELPVFTKVGNSKKVEANSRNTIVFALQKFTIPDAKYFFIEIGEKNGGRHLRMKVRNNKLLKAKLLPTYR